MIGVGRGAESALKPATAIVILRTYASRRAAEWPYFYPLGLWIAIIDFHMQKECHDENQERTGQK